jgi:hypothetical protein
VPFVRNTQVASRGPNPSCRVIEFRALQVEGAIASASHQDFAGRQQCRGVFDACGVKAAGRAPQPSRRIIKFFEVSPQVSSRHKHFAGRQQRRGVKCVTTAVLQSQSMSIADHSSASEELTSPPTTSTLPTAATSRCECSARTTDAQSQVPVAVVKFRAAQVVQ